ncbi:MAG TPA: arginine decarboxylase, pyruvoyl-dependent [Methanosarcinaceae archaeon]|nr:arginine decarboxylase, pyruvoyl-dependent [Methanosarcinaceae archaeon]
MNMNLVPKKAFFTSGVGRHTEYLESFEVALRNAGIEKYNLVTVSSILPPQCMIVSKEEGLAELSPGQIVFCVMSRISSDEPSRLITSSIGCAIPKDINMHGYISEHHAFGQTKAAAGNYAEQLAKSMYHTWTKEEPIKTVHITRAADVDEELRWTTVLSAVVFVI